MDLTVKGTVSLLASTAGELLAYVYLYLFPQCSPVQCHNAPNPPLPNLTRDYHGFGPGPLRGGYAHLPNYPFNIYKPWRVFARVITTRGWGYPEEQSFHTNVRICERKVFGNQLTLIWVLWLLNEWYSYVFVPIKRIFVPFKWWISKTRSKSYKLHCSGWTLKPHRYITKLY